MKLEGFKTATCRGVKWYVNAIVARPPQTHHIVSPSAGPLAGKIEDENGAVYRNKGLHSVYVPKPTLFFFHLMQDPPNLDDRRPKLGVH